MQVQELNCFINRGRQNKDVIQKTWSKTGKGQAMCKQHKKRAGKGKNMNNRK